MLWCKAATWVRVKDAALRLLAKGFDGKPHQLPAQLLFGRFPDFPASKRSSKPNSRMHLFPMSF
jgi:hypothetical protein